MEGNKKIEQTKRSLGHTVTAIIILICTLLLFTIILKQKNKNFVGNEFSTPTQKFAEETPVEIIEPENAIKIYTQKAFIPVYVEDTLGYGELEYGFLTKGFELSKDEEYGYWWISGLVQHIKNEIPYGLAINLSVKNDPPLKIDDYEFEVVYFYFNYNKIIDKINI